MATDYTSMSGARGPSGQDSAANLLSRLVSDVTALFRNELALAKAEFSKSGDEREARSCRHRHGARLLAGALSLVAAAILGLAEVLDPWLAALVVGVVLGVDRIRHAAICEEKLDPSISRSSALSIRCVEIAEIVARRT
jgi:Protein of unknown function (DUF1469).